MLRQCPLCLWMRRVVRRRHVMLTALSHASSSRTGLASTWRCRGRRAGIAVADLSLFSVPALTLPRNYENHLTHSTLSPGIVIYDGTSSNNDFTHDSVTYTAVQGTKEHDYCSNRGFCDQTKGAWTWCVDGWMCGYVGGHVCESGVLTMAPFGACLWLRAQVTAFATRATAAATNTARSVSRATAATCSHPSPPVPAKSSAAATVCATTTRRTAVSATTGGKAATVRSALALSISRGSTTQALRTWHTPWPSAQTEACATASVASACAKRASPAQHASAVRV